MTKRKAAEKNKAEEAPREEFVIGDSINVHYKDGEEMPCYFATEDGKYYYVAHNKAVNGMLSRFEPCPKDLIERLEKTRPQF